MKPYHHDAAAIKEDKARTQNITVGVSFEKHAMLPFNTQKQEQRYLFH